MDATSRDDAFDLLIEFVCDLRDEGQRSLGDDEEWEPGGFGGTEVHRITDRAAELGLLLTPGEWSALVEEYAS